MNQHRNELRSERCPADTGTIHDGFRSDHTPDRCLKGANNNPTTVRSKNERTNTKMRTTYPTELLDPEFLWDESGYDEKYGPRNPRQPRTYRVKKLS